VPATDDRPRRLPPRQAALLSASRVERKGNIFVKWITSTDHKTIGYMYLIVSVIFFLLAGVMALIMRAELFAPGMQIIPTKEQYNQLFTMHGTIMLLLFATPLFAGFANAILPLQLGAPDVAFPRLNAFALWLFVFGGTLVIAGFLTPQGAASFGWFAYQPLASASFSPGVGGNLWMVGLIMSGFGTIFGAVNFITTIVTMRAPGMTMWRMPIFSWNTPYSKPRRTWRPGPVSAPARTSRRERRSPQRPRTGTRI
jgi:cytochrome c oxidase subunit 1